MKTRVLYKFCSFETRRHKKFVRNIIMKRELYFSDPSTFNDPYDCSIGLYLRGFLNPFGVLCFSTEGCDMILMFSHYANRHKGVCLQFEIDEDNTGSLFGREVTYEETIPHFKGGSEAHMTLLTKYKKWEYEKEYRVLRNVNSDKDRSNKYKLSELRGAIFGMHMTSSDEHLVRCWFKKGGHKTPFFKKAQLSEDGFALRYIDV